MLHQVAADHLEKGLKSGEDFHHILQGFRNRKTLDFYLKLRSTLIDQKLVLSPPPKEGGEKAWATNLVNLFFSFASNKQREFGAYK